MALESVGSSPAFPTLALKSTTRIISSYNISVKKRAPVSLHNINKNNIKLLFKLYKLGIVNSFSLSNHKRSSRLHPVYYSGVPYVSSLKSITTNTKSFTISIKGVYLLKKYSGLSTVLIRSTKGINTIQEAANSRSAGSLFAVAS